jgi:hypothetical protein
MGAQASRSCWQRRAVAQRRLPMLSGCRKPSRRFGSRITSGSPRRGDGSEGHLVHRRRPVETLVELGPLPLAIRHELGAQTHAVRRALRGCAKGDVQRRGIERPGLDEVAGAETQAGPFRASRARGRSPPDFAPGRKSSTFACRPTGKPIMADTPASTCSCQASVPAHNSRHSPGRRWIARTSPALTARPARRAPARGDTPFMPLTAAMPFMSLSQAPPGRGARTGRCAGSAGCASARSPSSRSTLDKPTDPADSSAGLFTRRCGRCRLSPPLCCAPGALPPRPPAAR